MINEETLEEYFLGKMKEVLLFDNDAQAIRFMEKYFEAKWQQERMYSEMDIVLILSKFRDMKMIAFSEWFEQFKKK